MLNLEILNNAAQGKCRFYYDGPRLMVEIGDSRARLFVNGRHITRSELRLNDQLVVGSLRLKITEDGQVQAPAQSGRTGDDDADGRGSPVVA